MPSRYSTREYRLVQVFVEGYDDVAFWRGIFDDYETEWLKFEISVPPRQDLAKGKKVLLGMIGECCDDRILCVDSDFDYLFEDFNEQSRQVNRTPSPVPYLCLCDGKLSLLARFAAQGLQSRRPRTIR